MLAKFKKLKETDEGTYLLTFVPKKIDDIYFFDDIGSGSIELDDNRSISSAQRHLIYSLLSDIAYYSLKNRSRIAMNSIKKTMKAKFQKERECDEFSLSNVNMSLANEFIEYLLDFIMLNNVELKFESFAMSRELKKWSYLCIKNRRCTVCEKSCAVIHHLEAVGMGRNRNKVNHSKLLMIALCSFHHTEIHNIGDMAFKDKYHCDGTNVDVDLLKKLNIKGRYEKGDLMDF